MVNKALLLVLAVFVALLLVTAACSGDDTVINQPPTQTQGSALSPDLASISLEWALSSGKPTLAEFGRGICIPCKAMKPVLEDLAVEYEDRLNVVIVEVDEYRDLSYQYGIMAIPTQVFFDSEGSEIARHIGFWSKEEIIVQLKKMGIE